MIENINGYFIPTACFLLLFLSGFLLLERYKKSIRAFSAKHSRLLTKIPWNTIAKILSVWGFILFSRKLIYYLPIPGVIQTKNTIWCGNGYLPFVFFVFFWLSGVLIQTLYPLVRSQSKSRRKFDKMGLIFIGAGIFAVFYMYKVANISFGHFLILFFSTPLVVLKMVCPGKYLGFLISLILAFFTIYGYKKRKKIPLNTKGTIFFWLFFAVVILGGIVFQGDWEQRFISKVQIAKTQSAFEELLEAAQSITDDNHKSNILWHIAAAITKTGDNQWARSVAGKIPDEEIKNNALEEIRGKIEEQ